MLKKIRNDAYIFETMMLLFLLYKKVICWYAFYG